MTDAAKQSGPKNDMLRTAAATILNVVPYAMLIPQVIVHLGNTGASATAVSIYGLTPFAVVLTMSPLTPRLLRFLGLGAAHLAGLSIAAIALLATSVLLLAGSVELATYVGLAALLGAATAMTWTATEATIAVRAPSHSLGTLTAMYQTGLGIAFVAGPFVPVAMGLERGGILVVTSLLMGAALLLSASSFGKSTPSGRNTTTDRVAPFRWPLVGPILVTAFVGGLFEVGLNAIFPYIALDAGLSSNTATMLVGAIAFGALAGQFPLVLFSDRVATVASIRSSAVLLVCGALALGASHGTPPLLWLSAVLFGGGGGALYTLAMIEIGRSRDGQPVAVLTSAVVSVYTLGAVIGSLGSGLVLDTINRTALWIALALLPAAILLTTLIRFTTPRKET